VTGDGSVYAWGMKSGDSRQPQHYCSMGFGEVAIMLKPTPIPSFCPGLGRTPIRCVAAGVSHTLFISVFHEVYAVGRTHSGKLGLGQTSGCDGQVLEPTKVKFQGVHIPRIIAASAAVEHSLFLCASGKVWGCGQAKFGQLPTSHACTTNQCVWTPVPLDRLHTFCTGVAAGISMSFFVGECGEVYMSGSARMTHNPFHRPTDHNIATPFRIPDLRQVEQVSVSMELCKHQWEHAIFVCQDVSLYAWGHL